MASSTCISSVTTSSSVSPERLFRRAAYRPPHPPPDPDAADAADAASTEAAAVQCNPYAWWLQAIRSSLF